MPASIIVNEQEVRRWFEQGRPYSYMIEQYQTKYGRDTTIAYWSKWRQRHGIERRNVRDDKLIPWKVEEQHRYDWDILNLRKEARRRAGKPLPEGEDDVVDGWIRGLEADGAVIHYEPETEQGWFRVPRREGVDFDLIREPEQRDRTGYRNLDKVDAE